MIIALVFGACCMTPCLIWFKFVFCPTRQQREERREMHRRRRDRVDEQARVTREKVKLARLEDERRRKANEVNSIVICCIYRSFLTISIYHYFINS